MLPIAREADNTEKWVLTGVWGKKIYVDTMFLLHGQDKKFYVATYSAYPHLLRIRLQSGYKCCDFEASISPHIATNPSERK